jgi:hypothetical protein
VGPRLLRPKAFGERILAGEVGEPDQGVDVGGENLAVNRGRRAEEPPLQARRQSADGLQEPVLCCRREARKSSHQRRKATPIGAGRGRIAAGRRLGDACAR